MNIFITLDYELFMGDPVGSPMKCMVEPMSALLDLAQANGIRLVIFVDAAYLYRLSQLAVYNRNLQVDLDLIRGNLFELVNAGHDVELHFHPQWLYSNYIDGEWKLDFKHYKLADMPYWDTIELFKEAKKYLDETIGRRTIAFRAGGYSLNSFSGYADLLRQNDIKIDSSVVGRRHVKSKFQAYDYRKVPQRDSWAFETDLNFEVINGSIIEYPISTTIEYFGPFYALKKQKLISLYGSDYKWGDGKGIGFQLSYSERLLVKLKKIFMTKSFPASIDGFLTLLLPVVYEQLLKFDKENMVIIGHPKNISPKSLKYLDSFLRSVVEKNKFLTFDSII